MLVSSNLFPLFNWSQRNASVAPLWVGGWAGSGNAERGVLDQEGELLNLYIPKLGVIILKQLSKVGAVQLLLNPVHPQRLKAPRVPNLQTEM